MRRGFEPLPLLRSTGKACARTGFARIVYDVRTRIGCATTLLLTKAQQKSLEPNDIVWYAHARSLCGKRDTGMRKYTWMLLFLLLTGLTARADVLKTGDRGDEVAALQRRLIELDYLEAGQDDGIFGGKTQTALKNFQGLNDLPRTGEADEATMGRLAETEAFHDTLKKGDKGEGVTVLQEGLIHYGFLDGRADGHFGEQTKKAVLALQGAAKAAGLSVGKEGEADHALQLLLKGKGGSLYAGPLKTGDEGDAVLLLQKRLSVLGYYDMEPGGAFDEYTKACVKAFRAQAGLPESGEMDRETYDLLVGREAPRAPAPVPRDIGYGDEGHTVRWVRDELGRLGFLNGVPHDTFDGGLKSGLDRLRDQLGEADFLEDSRSLTVEEQQKLAELGPLYVQDLRSGDKGSQVYRLQRRLCGLYYLGTADIDGKIGKKTVAAITRFQELAGLEPTGIAEEGTQKLLFSGDAPRDHTDYRLMVSIADQRVYAYRTGADGSETLLKTMICSTGLGNSTPTGIFRRTMPQHNWHYFKDFTCWAQCTYIIQGNIMFHSVLFWSRSESAMNRTSLNNLGRKASHGCIRLMVEDARWIFDNCKPGTIVVIAESFPG